MELWESLSAVERDAELELAPEEATDWTVGGWITLSGALVGDPLGRSPAEADPG